MNAKLSTFVFAHGANAFSIGIQMVLVAWLATGVLHLPASQIGWIQAAVLAPNVLLLLFAGAVSDRFHPSVVLALSNFAMVFVHCAALVTVFVGDLHLWNLLAYGAALGCCNSFIQSSREKLVAFVSTSMLHRRIAITGIVQQMAQATGIILASLSDWLGAEPLLALQGVLCASAAVLYLGMRQLSIPTEASSVGLTESIRDGLTEVWQNVAVRHTVLIVAFNGLMHLGMFIVLLPVMARDQMGFRSLEYGLLQLCFSLGGMLVQGVILRKKQVEYPGQAVLFCLLYAGLIGFALSMGPTVTGLFILIFLWGCVAGSSANLSRLVVQSVMPPSHRGRAMAVYQLALFGSAPFGALLAGWLLTVADSHAAFRLIGWSSAGLFCLSLLSRPLWAVSPQRVG